MESPYMKHDWKRHCSINVETGLWQCFKSGKTGNFVTLYAHLRGIPYSRAQQELIIKNFEHLGEEVPENITKQEDLELDTSKLIPINVESGYSDDPKVLAAWNQLWNRRLLTEEDPPEAEYYLCVEGKFANRIIIPFEQDGVTYYFQARALDAEQAPKYLNPSTDIAAKSSEVLYPFDDTQDYVVVCEGPLDAKSLQLQGVNATATMKNVISPRQAEILSQFKGRIILGYDNDSAGQRGLETFEKLRLERNMDPFYVCAPPPTFKDWNEAHQKHVSLPAWIERESSLYNFEYKMLNEVSSL
jgi:DNA primase